MSHDLYMEIFVRWRWTRSDSKKSLKSNDLQRIRCRQYKTLTTTREQKKKKIRGIMSRSNGQWSFACERAWVCGDFYWVLLLLRLPFSSSSFFWNVDCESVYHVVTLFVFYASFHRVAVYFHTKSNKTKFKSFDKQWRRTNRKPVADITAIDWNSRMIWPISRYFI